LNGKESRITSGPNAEEKAGVELEPEHIRRAKEVLRQFTDHYQVLGVSPNAGAEAIAAAYNEKGEAISSAPDFKTNAELQEQMRKLNQALQLLSDAEQRLEYDSQLRSVREALKRLEPDAGWVQGKARAKALGITYLKTKQAAATILFLAMMTLVSYVTMKRKQEQAIRSTSRHTGDEQSKRQPQ